MGRVRVCRVGDEDENHDNDENNAYDTPYHELVAEHVAQLRAETPGQRIAVLVRTKGEIYSGVIAGLQARGIPAHGEGGITIGDHPAVGHVLALLRLSALPNDKAAWTCVRLGPIGTDLGESCTSPASTSAWVQLQCMRHGLVGFIERVIASLRQRVNALGTQRLEQLLTLATSAVAADASLNDHPDRLADIVARQPVRTASDIADVVQVMTIHASKGLEFDLVVLPETHIAFGSRDGQKRVLAVRDTPSAPPHTVVPWPTKKQRAQITQLDTWAAAAEVDAREEDLCLLYVAMTRAVHGLDIVTPCPFPQMREVDGDERPVASAGSLIALALGGPNDDPEAIGCRTCVSHGQWPPPPRPAPPAEPEPVPLTLQMAGNQPTRRHRHTVTPSGLAAGDRAVRPRDLLDPAPNNGMAIGTLAHALLEDIGFIDREPIPEVSALHQRAYTLAAQAAQHAIDADLATTIAERVHSFLTSPAADALRSNGASECWRERPFVVTRDDGSLLSGSFDRVHVWRDTPGGSIHKAVVLDYKTDHISDAASKEAIREHYEPQMAAYRDALTHMLGIDDVSSELVFLSEH